VKIEQIVRVPYTTRPTMIRNNESVYNMSPDPEYIRQKKHQLLMFDNALYGETEDAVKNDLVRRAATYLSVPITTDIVEFSFNFEEDVAILHQGVLSAICFCFPSSWTPGAGLGKSLRELHAPVADGELLVKASDKIASTISDFSQGSFRRYVWTITKVPSLSNYEKITEQYKDEDLDINTLFMRIETQTTLPLPNGAIALFFVKVDVLPLKDVWYRYKNLLLQSLSSMSDNIIRYKNLGEIRSYLLSVA
jgi:hypothetical protein